MMAVFVTADREFPAKEPFVRAIVKMFPRLTTIIWVVNPTVTNIARGEVREILHGQGYIEENILGYRFRIHPGSFFQTNSRQAETLYQSAIDLAGIKPHHTALDLYCGAGTIALCMAKRAEEVIGIEIEPEAVKAARMNACINKIGNARFFAGEARKVMYSDELKDITFDRVFVDPPRAGMHPKALKRLIEIGAPRIIYVSCNPATFARDAKELAGAGYSLDTVIPFDMFPHTMHIELIARFRKNG
jgi:23S rRNA (uracil1939-C5)-methyltransferase